MILKSQERDFIIFICGQSDLVLKDFRFNNHFSKVAENKNYTHKSVVFLYINSKYAEKLKQKHGCIYLMR